MSGIVIDQIDENQGDKEVTANELFLAAGAALGFGQQVSATSGLTYGQYGGVKSIAGVPTLFGNQTILMTASSSNYIRQNSDGTMTVTTSPPSGWPGPLLLDAVANARVETDTGSITSVIDYRLASGQPGATGAAGASVSSRALLYSASTVPGGNTVASSTSEVAFTSAYTLPANSVSVGDVIAVKLYGVYGTTGTPTLTLKIKFGSTVIVTTGTPTMTTGITDLGWTLDALLTIQAIGGSGSVEAQAAAEFSTAATTGLTINAARTSAITFSTTTTQAITVTAQWSASSASNTITLREMSVEQMRVGTVTAYAQRALVMALIFGE